MEQQPDGHIAAERLAEILASEVTVDSSLKSLDVDSLDLIEWLTVLGVDSGALLDADVLDASAELTVGGVIDRLWHAGALSTDGCVPMRTIGLPTVAKTLESCRERGLISSAQVAVHSRDARGCVAAGRTVLGREATVNTSYPWTCASKPLLATTIGTLVDDDALTFDDPIGIHLGIDISGLGGVTIAELLTHTAPVPDVAAELFLSDLDATGEGRARALERIVTEDPDLSRWPTSTASYSFFANWFLLSEVVARVTNQSPEVAIWARVLAPLSLTASLSLTLEQVQSLDRAPLKLEFGDVSRSAEALGPFALSGTPENISLLDGRSPQQYIPGCSAVGPIASLVELLSVVAEDAHGARRLLNKSTAVRMVQPARVGIHDRVKDNDLSWGLGFTVDSRAFSPRFADIAFGHVGWDATCLAFCDRATGVSVGFATDQLARSTLDRVARQLVIVDAIIRDLESVSLL